MRIIIHISLFIIQFNEVSNDMQMISPTRLASFNDMQDSNFFSVLNICCEKPVQPNYMEYMSLQHALL